MAGRKGCRRTRKNAGQPPGYKTNRSELVGPALPSRLRPIRSLIVTIIAQITGFCGALFLAPLLLVDIPPTFLHLMGAISFTRIFGLTIPWQLCNALIPLGLCAELGTTIPFSLFIVTLLIFGPTLAAPIPFYPTRRGVYQHLAQTVATHSPRRVVDLGSGFGAVLFALAGRYPKSSFIGYEIGLIPLIFSHIRSWWYANASMYRESFWQVNLGQFDLVYAFLSPPAMGRLEEKLLGELADDALFISNSFPLPRSSPFRTVIIGGQSLLYYRRCDILAGLDTQNGSVD